LGAARVAGAPRCTQTSARAEERYPSGGASSAAIASNIRTAGLAGRSSEQIMIVAGSMSVMGMKVSSSRR